MKGTLQDWENDRSRREIENDLALIEALPEFEPEGREVPEPVEAPEPCVLMERSCGGWATSLEWHPATGLTCTVRQGFEATPYVFAVPADADPLDVFEHPYVYDPRGK